MTKLNGKEIMAGFSVGFITIMSAIALAFFTNEYMWLILNNSKIMQTVNFFLWITVYVNLISVIIKYILGKISMR
jgi:hypothetical protein